MHQLSLAHFASRIKKKVPFEINVSVPKGVGKAESEGGSKDNTVGQAFVRDPDGYYLEICNCHLLDDFVLGLSDESLLIAYDEGIKPVKRIMFGLLRLYPKIAAWVKRSKKNCSQGSSPMIAEPLPVDEQPDEADPVILNNLVKRRAVYGDICQSFSSEQISQILREAGNSTPTALLLMRQRIKSGEVSKVYQPPSYYVGKIDDAAKFDPTNLTAGKEEKGRDMAFAPTKVPVLQD